MTTATVERAQTGMSPQQPPRVGPIIVASDGGAAAATALTIARLLRDRTGAEIRAVSVVEPTAAVVPAPLLLTTPVPESRVQQRHDAVREQIDRIVGTTPQVPLEIAVGWPPEVLAQLVRDRDASFFVAGLVHHGRMERMARTETPLAVLRGARAPVLALPWGMMREPRSVVIGVDLTDASVKAAAHAAPLMQGADKVYLIHVQEPIAPLSEMPALPAHDETAAREAIARVRSVLRIPAEARVEARVLVGHPAFELADFAEYVQADLLVLGHEHRGLWGRMLHSSVAERAYRLATCGVLIVPDNAPALTERETAAHGVITESVTERERWAGELQGFTRRNAGRRVNLEILTSDLGAQSASVNFPLYGVDYDPESNTVEIMLGDAERRQRHLTHFVRAVSAVEVSRFAEGTDWSLRIVHEGGATLLTFVA